MLKGYRYRTYYYCGYSKFIKKNWFVLSERYSTDMVSKTLQLKSGK